MNIKKFLVGSAAAALMFGTLATGAFAANTTGNGFDQYGYNNNARVFNGNCVSWYIGKFSADESAVQVYCGNYSNDKLIMKWNAAWDACNQS